MLSSNNKDESWPSAFFGAKKPTPPRPPEPQLPAVSDTAARRYQDVAAAAAAHVAEMENEILKWRNMAESLKVELRAEQAIRADREGELAHTRNDCDFYRGRSIDLESRLKAVEAIVKDILKTVHEVPSAQAEPQSPETIIDSGMKDMIVQDEIPDAGR